MAWLIAVLLRIGVSFSLLAGAVVLAFVSLQAPAVGWAVLGLAFYHRWRMKQRTFRSSCGTARLADFIDLVSNGLVGGRQGIVLGRAGLVQKPGWLEGWRCLLFWRPAASIAAATLTTGARTEEEVAAATDAGPRIVEVAADKGYHKAETLEFAEELGLRTYIPEGKRKRRKGAKKARPGRSKRKRACDSPAVKRNRERMKRAKGKELGRRRSEVVERSFAHVCRTGGARRTQLRGKEKIRKRYSMAAAARNLGLLTLKLFGVGKPRSLQGVRDRLLGALEGLLRLQERFLALAGALGTDLRVVRLSSVLFRATVLARVSFRSRAGFSTGC